MTELQLKMHMEINKRNEKNGKGKTAAKYGNEYVIHSLSYRDLK